MAVRVVLLPWRMGLWGLGLTFLVSCFSSSSKSNESRTPSSSTSTGSGELTLAGTPSNAAQDLYYAFYPQVQSVPGRSLKFTFHNLPSWAVSDSSRGGWTGYPSQPGTSAGIQISVEDGANNSAVLSPLSVTVTGDPLREYAWHLNNVGQSAFAQLPGLSGYDLNVLPVWRRGIFGSGVRVAVSDSGMEIHHEDLSENILAGASKDYRGSAPYTGGDPSPDPNNNDGDHGTSVSGLIAARGWNGVGSRGVAPLARLAGVNYLGDGVSQTTSKLVDQADGDFDVFNQSWGADTEGDSPLSTSYQNQLAYGASQLRSGRGALYVKAAGNSFQPYTSFPWMTLDANADPFNTSPYLIVVGALNAKGVKASYASVGSCIWVSGFGGEYGTTNPAMITTDRSGCDKGYSVSSATENDFEKGGSPNSQCNYTSTFNGTSSATPTISGVVALMLEANPSLTWREVKHILAVTAKQVDPNFTPISGRSIDSANYVWEPGWTVNAAGYRFHNYYGFGGVDAGAAVDLARSWTPYFKTFQSYTSDSGTLALTIPDDQAAGVTHGQLFAHAILVESVVVEVSATHPYTGDLGIELTSPSGTRNILFHANNAFSDDEDLDGLRLLSNAFYGESAYGTWTLRVVDANPGEAGTRTLTRWRITVYGRAAP